MGRKIRRLFREEITTLMKLSKQKRIDFMERADAGHPSELMPEPNKVLNRCVSNWLKEKDVARRKLLHIKTDASTFVELLEKISFDLAHEVGQHDDTKVQHVMLEDFFQDTYRTFGAYNTIVVEFDEEVYFDRLKIGTPNDKFTEVIISAETIFTYNGFTGEGLYIENTGVASLLFCFLFSDKLSEVVSNTDNDIIKYRIAYDYKIEKRCFKSNKLANLWNYGVLNCSSQTIPKSNKRRSCPIDFSTREEVILERKPYYRRLRNGELRLFTGIKATYYKLKNVEKIGTIIRV